MNNTMELPKYFSLVRLVAQIGAILGCIGGAVTILVGLGAFSYGFMAGMSSIFSGVVIVVLSLAGLGMTYCFLAIVQAQVESRNAIIAYTNGKGDSRF